MKTLISVLLTLFMIQFTFGQEKIYFPLFETINVNTKYQYVTSKLFKNYVERVGKYEIILPTELGVNNKYYETFEKSKSEAKRLNTSYFIISDMSSIGNLMIVNMKMYNTASGALVWSDGLRASNLEDLDPVIQLLARSIGEKKSAVAAGDIYSITQHESRQLNKINATDSWALLIGGGGVFSSNIKSSGQSGFGMLKSYDMRNLILDIKAEFYFGEKSLSSSRIGINVLFPKNQSDLSIFYGGGVFYGGTMYSTQESEYEYDNYAENHNSGLELEGNFGVIMNRTSSIQLRATASPFINLYQVEGNSIAGIRLGIVASF